MNLDLPASAPWWLGLVVAALSIARLTRLITQDTYPPAAWLRSKWQGWTHDGDWSELVTCPFCAAPYIAAAVLAWGWFSGPHWTWWAFNGWLAFSYVASMIVVRDTPE